MTTSRLRLGARIARGGMAEVFAARLVGPAGFEKDVAVKRVLPRYADDPVFLQRFLAEARLAARLSHPNVVQIFELGNDGRDHYIVMEAVRGATLRQVLQRLDADGARLPVGLALFIARSVCAGLAHAHELTGVDGQPLRIIHRDVSPQNVLLGHEGAVKLIDFGIAQAADSERLTRVGRPLGKPHYMAPEQIGGAPLDARADLFAVGVLLYEMLTGQRPFDADDDVEIAARIRRGERRPIRALEPDLDPAIAALVDQALSVNPAQRPASARAFAAALADLMVRTGARADAHDLEQLLGRLLPDDVARPWPVDDERLDEAEHTRTAAGGGGARDITLSSDAVDDGTVAVASPPPPSSKGRARRMVGLVAVLVGVVGVVGVGVWATTSDHGAADGGPGDAGLVAIADAASAHDAGLSPGAVVDAGALEALAVALDGGVASDAGVAADDDDADDIDIDDVVDGGREAAPVDAGGVPPRAVVRPRVQRPAARTGRLIVETRPWSEVRVDGRLLGVTPLSTTVRVGRRRLTLSNPEQSLRRELTVVVDDDAPAVVRVDLRSP